MAATTALLATSESTSPKGRAMPDAWSTLANSTLPLFAFYLANAVVGATGQLTDQYGLLAAYCGNIFLITLAISHFLQNHLFLMDDGVLDARETMVLSGLRFFNWFVGALGPQYMFKPIYEAIADSALLYWFEYIALVIFLFMIIVILSRIMGVTLELMTPVSEKKQ